MSTRFDAKMTELEARLARARSGFALRITDLEPDSEVILCLAELDDGLYAEIDTQRLVAKGFQDHSPAVHRSVLHAFLEAISPFDIAGLDEHINQGVLDGSFYHLLLALDAGRVETLLMFSPETSPYAEIEQAMRRAVRQYVPGCV